MNSSGGKVGSDEFSFAQEKQLILKRVDRNAADQQSPSFAF